MNTFSLVRPASCSLFLRYFKVKLIYFYIPSCKMSDREAINTFNMLTTTKIDPTEFDVTISSLLIGLGAEKYIDIFRKKNIGQSTLIELSDEDLRKLGVDDEDIRTKILEEVKNLPIFRESSDHKSQQQLDLGPIEIADLLEESGQHLYRVYLSLLANTLAVKKNKAIGDCLLYKDKFASDIALSTMSEITRILNSMDVALHTQMKDLTKEPYDTVSKKIAVGVIGSACITALAVLFVRSLNQL